MAIYVKRIRAFAIYGRIDLEQKFEPKINVLYGKNGVGKTTLLHILANALNGQYERFAYLKFDSIHIELSDNTGIEIRQTQIGKDSVIRIQHPGTDNKSISFPIADVHLAESEASSRRSSLGRRAEVARLPQLENVEPPLPTAYFPAFRSMIEAWRSLQEERDIIYREYRDQEIFGRSATYFARELFGAFIPAVTYPSPNDISVGLSEEYRKASLTVGDTTRRLLSQAFLDIFAALSGSTGRVEKNSETILKEIQSLISQLETIAPGEEIIPGTDIVTALRKRLETFRFAKDKSTSAADILEVYQKILKEIVNVQESSFEGITAYVDSVNDFLEGKKLEVKRDKLRPSVQIKFDNNSSGNPRALSSGERQILTMIYAASRMSSQQLVLIDEPEISLHVDWQELLLNKLSKQIQNRQIIVCTHSPIIGGDYDMKELSLIPTHRVSHPNQSFTGTETEGYL